MRENEIKTILNNLREHISLTDTEDSILSEYIFDLQKENAKLKMRNVIQKENITIIMNKLQELSDKIKEKEEQK